MNKSKNYFKKIQLLVDKKAKIRIIWLIIFSVFISILETFTLASIMPFIDIATNFDKIQTDQYYQQAFIFLGLQSEVNFAIVLGFFLVVLFIFRGLVNLVHSHVIFNFSESLYAQITQKLFETYLKMPYKAFVKKNSSYLTKAIVSEASQIPYVINSVLLMMSEALVIIFLYILMMATNWKITIVVTVILLFKMLFLSKTISKKIKSVGVIREKSGSQYYEIINKFFGNFKQLKLQDQQRIEGVKDEFSTAIKSYANANAVSSFLSSVPRLFIETFAFSMMVILLTSLVYLAQEDVAFIIPTISLFAIILYRFLPSINRIINGYNSVMYYHKSIDVVESEFATEQEILGDQIIEFKEKIELIDVNFSYEKNEVLRSVNLIIYKGEKVAIIGESGSGKSTLVDLIIGLHRADQGKIQIDNNFVDNTNLLSWRSQVGYVPQQVYLFDGTIAENVCFGRNEDKHLLETVLKQANIFDFLQTKQGLNTLVGEGGVQLSGGQKQRIAIARALYGQPEILVLDEATSALDSKTEGKVMQEIYQITQNKTLIIIAHRLSTIKYCDRIYRMKSGKLN